MSRTHPGRFHIAIPGPTNIPERILNAMHISSEDQRNPEIPDLTIPLYKDVKKVLQSAIANAENNHDLDIDKLVVSEAYVGKALVMKRFRPRARGRGGKILKPISNLTIIVREDQEEE